MHRRHRDALSSRRDRSAAEHQMLTITSVGSTDLPELMPMLRAYCDFYRVQPSDERLLALATALVDDPSEGQQLIAREPMEPQWVSRRSTGRGRPSTPLGWASSMTCSWCRTLVGRVPDAR